MEKILELAGTESQEITPAFPFYLFVEGDLAGKTIQAEYRRKDGTTWYVEQVFSTTERTLQFNGSNGDFVWRVTTTAAGIEVYWGNVLTNQV